MLTHCLPFCLGLPPYFPFPSPPLPPPSAVSDLARRMCWKLVAEKREEKGLKDRVGAAIWQKPESNDCYSQKEKGSQPPMCEAQDTPDAAW